MKKSKITILLLIISALVFGQEKTNISNPSSNAMSAGVFQDYPISLATGVPLIEIPIYTINYRSVSIPIKLEYNSNLVKPDLHPGWVGLGWNLSAGGSISRIVNDVKDEYQWGYYYTHGAFAWLDWASDAKLRTAIDNRRRDPNSDDSQPDEFNFSFLGFSGSFYLDELGNWKVRSSEELKVIIDMDDVTIPSNLYIYGRLGKITLVDSKGVQYVFGGELNAIEFSSPLFTKSISFVSNTWHLSKIILPNNEIIKFNYGRGEPTISPQPIYWWNLASYNKLRFTGSTTLTSYLENIQTATEQVTFSRSPSTELKYDVNAFQYEILSTGTISYTCGPYPGVVNQQADCNNVKWNKLDTIKVFSKNSSKAIKTFKLTYNNILTERLKLQQVAEYALGEQERSKNHLLTYNDDIALPPYFANQNDYWGFYNNTNPDYSTSTNFFNSRAVNVPYLQAEILKQIKYPTGGYIKYIFEPHTYSKELQETRWLPLITYSSDKIASGLRVKRVERFNHNNEIVDVREYVYQRGYNSVLNSGLSSGILGGKTDYRYREGPPGQPNNYSVDLVNYLPLAINSNGSNIAYSEVTEIFPDQSYEVNKLSNFDNGTAGEYMDMAPVYSQLGSQGVLSKFFTSKSFERGRLLQKSSFTATDKIVAEQRLAYERLNEFTGRVRGYALNFGIDNGQNTVYAGKAIIILTYPYLLKSNTTTVYDLNGLNPVTSVTNYNYNDEQQISSTTTTSSMGKSVEIINTYPKDLVSQPGYHEPVYDQMLLANNTSTIIQTLKKVGEVPTELHRTEYKQIGSSLFVPSSEIVRYGTGSEKTLNVFTNYDEFGNLLSAKKINGSPTSYMYGYKSQYLVAEVKNAENTFSEKIITSQFGQRHSYQNGNEYNTVSEHQLGSFTLNVDGKVKIIPQGDGVNFNGSVNIYCYLTGPNSYSKSFTLNIAGNNPGGPSGKELILENLSAGTYTLSSYAIFYVTAEFPCDVYVAAVYPIGITYSGVKDFYYESFEEGTGNVINDAKTGNYSHNGQYTKTINYLNSGTYKVTYWKKSGGRWILNEYLTSISGSSYTIDLNGQIDDIRLYPKDAQMTTYTYNPLVGMTSMTDPREQTIYYKYDDFQRLSQVKDDKGNILKQYCYNYAGQQTICSLTNPDWQYTNTAIRCKLNVNNQNTGEQEQEQKDINPISPTYNQTRWVVKATNTTSCPLPSVLPNWQNTATAIRCKVDGNSQNTGEQEQEQKDLNPASATYNQLRWVVVATNTTSCPVDNCATCTGFNARCINDTCEYGVLVYTASIRDESSGDWACYYHYEYSDGSWSDTYISFGNSPCY